jgi:hypothetical protein
VSVGAALVMAMRAAISCGWTVTIAPEPSKPLSLHDWLCTMTRPEIGKAALSYSCYFGGDDMALTTSDWIREIIRAHG